MFFSLRNSDGDVFPPPCGYMDHLAVSVTLLTIKVDLDQYFLTLAAHWKHLGSFSKTTDAQALP